MEPSRDQEFVTGGKKKRTCNCCNSHYIYSVSIFEADNLRKLAVYVTYLGSNVGIEQKSGKEHSDFPWFPSG